MTAAWVAAFAAMITALTNLALAVMNRRTVSDRFAEHHDRISQLETTTRKEPPPR